MSVASALRARPMTDLPVLEGTRRLPGPNRLFDRAGVIIDMAASNTVVARFLPEWALHARRLLEALGLPDSNLGTVCFEGGASVGLTAPIDILLAATEINEWAWDRACTTLAGPPAEPYGMARARIAALIAGERNRSLVDICDAARAHGRQFLWDDAEATVGSGTGHQSWPIDAVPAAAAVDWSAIRDIPTALVTGSNGKTTTVRLLAAMLRASGRRTGITSTDGVFADGTRLAAGDYSGPDGARRILRDPSVEAAVLETARGGILRRGLAVTRADVAIITNIAADHLGLAGVADLDGIADAKAVVARVLGDTGTLVLNADDPLLRRRWEGSPLRISWFGTRAAPDLDAWEAGGTMFVRGAGGNAVVVAEVHDVPVTLGGAARHNVGNALAAIAAASALGIPHQAIQSALQRFGRSHADNAGRANLYVLGGATILLDYAHNPHGMDALVGVVWAMPARRRLLLIGQAGDRDDDSIRGLARSAWAMRPDHVFLKEMAAYRRGRGPYDVPLLMLEEFRRLGAPAAHMEFAPSEVAGAARALAEAGPGDLVVLTVHAERARVLELLAACGARPVTWGELGEGAGAGVNTPLQLSQETA